MFMRLDIHIIIYIVELTWQYGRPVAGADAYLGAEGTARRESSELPHGAPSEPLPCQEVCRGLLATVCNEYTKHARFASKPKGCCGSRWYRAPEFHVASGRHLDRAG